MKEMRKRTKRKVSSAVSLGIFSYQSGNTAVHKMSAALKIALTCFISIRTFSDTNCFFLPHTFLTLEEVIFLRSGFYLLLSVTYALLARIGKDEILKLRGVLYISLFVIISRVFPFHFEELLGGALYAVRFITGALLALVSFKTTSKLNFYKVFYKLETLLSFICPPIKKLRLSLILFMSFLFIPEIFDTWHLISKASSSRIRNRKKLPMKIKIILASAEILCLFYNLLALCEDYRLSVSMRIKERK